MVLADSTGGGSISDSWNADYVLDHVWSQEFSRVDFSQNFNVWVDFDFAFRSGSIMGLGGHFTLTDIISGFVGETDEDFEQTLEVVKKAQFDNAFMFIYSPRAGTESFQEKETLSEEEKQERHERLVVIQNEITMQRNKLMFNRNEKILVERPSTKDPDEWVGKTENFKKVIFKPTKIVHPGDYVVCHINDIRGWTLRGEVVGE
jgi:tRNA A37 methylthiotransferase MiaB